MPRVARVHNVQVDSLLLRRDCWTMFLIYSGDDQLMIMRGVQGTLSKQKYGETRRQQVWADHVIDTKRKQVIIGAARRRAYADALEWRIVTSHRQTPVPVMFFAHRPRLLTHVLTRCIDVAHLV